MTMFDWLEDHPKTAWAIVLVLCLAYGFVSALAKNCR